MSFNSIISLHNALKFNLIKKNKLVMARYSKLNILILKKLICLGYVNSIIFKNEKLIKFIISNRGGVNFSFQGINLLSSPSNKQSYFGVKKLKRLTFNSGTVLLSTKSGILTKSEAIERNIGGKLLISIW